jgi:hypothetical protein
LGITTRRNKSSHRSLLDEKWEPLANAKLSAVTQKRD